MVSRTWKRSWNASFPFGAEAAAKTPGTENSSGNAQQPNRATLVTNPIVAI